MAPPRSIDIERVDHIGIRVRDEERAIAFYGSLGFVVTHRATNDAVVIVKNPRGVKINLVINADNPEGDHNILMDVETKYPGHTHIALRVSSIKDTIAALADHGIEITQGPVQFGQDGHVSVFVRDPDRNTIELRGRAENAGEIDGLTDYDPGG